MTHQHGAGSVREERQPPREGIEEVATGILRLQLPISLPGLGRLTVDSILRRDYPTIMGVLFFASAAVVVANILTDLSYRWADPRLREQ